MPYKRGQEIDSLENWVENNPNSIAFARLADYYLQSDDVDRAIQVCERGLQTYPDYSSAYFVLAKCFLVKRQYEDAEKRLKKVLMLDPKFLRAHRRYGDLMQEIGWEKSSEMSYKRVLEIDPLDEETRMEMERLQSQIPDKTDDFVDEASLVEPEPAIAEFGMGTDEALPSESISTEDLIRNQIVETEAVLEGVEQPGEFEEEEDRFTSILDDIFGTKMAEEERREEDARRTIEHAAKIEQEKLLEKDVEDTSLISGVVSPIESESNQKQEPEEEQKTVLPDVESDESLFPESQPMKAPEIPEEFKDTGSSVAEVENPFVGADIDEPFPEPYHDVQEITEPLTKSLFDTVDKGITDFDQIPYDVESEVSIPTPPQEPETITKDEQTLGIDSIDMGESALVDEETEEEELEFGSVLDDMEKVRLGQMTDEAEETQMREELGSIPREKPTDLKADTEPEQDMQQTKKEKIVTPTLGEIFAAQGQYAKAILVFENLHEKDPENQIYLKKIEELKRKMNEALE